MEFLLLFEDLWKIQQKQEDQSDKYKMWFEERVVEFENCTKKEWWLLNSKQETVCSA